MSETDKVISWLKESRHRGKQTLEILNRVTRKAEKCVSKKQSKRVLRRGDGSVVGQPHKTKPLKKKSEATTITADDIAFFKARGVSLTDADRKMSRQALYRKYEPQIKAHQVKRGQGVISRIESRFTPAERAEMKKLERSMAALKKPSGPVNILVPRKKKK